MVKSKLHLLFLFSTLLLSIHCACPSGYFTKTSACDTQATQIHCKEFTSRVVQAGQWQYFYIPLNGIEGNIELDFKLDGPVLNGYINFQPEGQYQLPDATTFDDRFEVQKGGREIPSQTLSNNMKKGNMLLGIYNKYTGNTELQIRYFTTEGDCKRGLSTLALGLIIGFSILAAGLFGIGVGICMHCKNLSIGKVSYIFKDRKKRVNRREGGQRERVQNTELVNQFKGSNNSGNNGSKPIELQVQRIKEHQETATDF